LKKKCVLLADEDSESFIRVMKAYRLPKKNPKRKEEVQKSLKLAVEIPLVVAKISDTLSKFAIEVAKKGNKNTYSDAKSAEYFAIAAKKSAMENVKINLPMIEDEKWKKKILL